MQASEPLSSSSFRYMSENIQFSRMKDVILPQVSTHQLYSYGYDDFSSDIPMQIDYKTNAYESNFYMDSSLYIQQDQLDTEAFCTESCINNYQSGPSSQMTIESLDCPSFGASHLSIQSPTVHNDYDNSNQQQHQLSHLQRLVSQQLKENPTCRTRKSPIENSNIIQKRSTEEKPSESEWTSTKKRAVCCQEQFQDYQNHKEIKIQKERAPVKRSQKLADKITALQKIVSPYGKTDTASVLHEASIFIKVLQDQIENMLNTQSSSSPADNKSIQHKNTGEKQLDLRNKGLCLAPVSLTQKLIKQDAFNQYSS